MFPNNSNKAFRSIVLSNPYTAIYIQIELGGGIDLGHKDEFSRSLDPPILHPIQICNDRVFDRDGTKLVWVDPSSDQYSTELDINPRMSSRHNK